MADRDETISVSYTSAGTVVKVVIKELGVTSSYSIKTYGNAVTASAKEARARAEENLKAALAAVD